MIEYLNDIAQERMSEIRAFASANGVADAFEGKVKQLESFASKGQRVLVYSDWADLSLGFTVQTERDGQWVPNFNGGLIYHGPAKSQDPLSVDLSQQEGHYWGIHT